MPNERNSDDQRVYSDEEFALILRKATELASRAEPTGTSSGGLTLSEIRAAAAQAGFDPALVDQAARLLATSAKSSPFERLIGGPMRLEHKIRFPVALDARRAAELLSAVRITAGEFGANTGHSGALGMTWRDGGDTEMLRVAAHTDQEGTSVSVVHDRRGTLALVGTFSGLVAFFAILFSVFALHPEAPALGYAGLLVGIGGPLAAARAYWKSSTRKVQERIGAVMDVIGKTLTK